MRLGDISNFKLLLYILIEIEQSKLKAKELGVLWIIDQVLSGVAVSPS
jgi:hypothetical protein